MPAWIAFLFGLLAGVLVCGYFAVDWYNNARRVDRDPPAPPLPNPCHLAHRDATIWIDGRELVGARSVYIQSAPGSCAAYGLPTSLDSDLGRGAREEYFRGDFDSSFDPRLWEGDRHA